MTIYLYVKTHNKTGLKYLGQTSSKDPHKYSGSGVYWKLHLEKHGYDYTTEILKECKSKEEIRNLGTYYSNLWNILESDEWANLKIEQGDGGRQSEEVRRRIGEAGKGRTPWNKGKQIWSEEERKLIGERNKLRGPQSAETIAKRVSKTTGKVRTEEQRKRSSDAQKGRKLTPEHIEKLKQARRKGFEEGRIVPWNKGLKVN
jgi:transposase